VIHKRVHEHEERSSERLTKMRNLLKLSKKPRAASEELH